MIEEYTFLKDISIHAPVKGATSEAEPSGLKFVISIHAPVKGATTIACNVVGSIDISIHAPVKGATETTHWIHYYSIFQSTLP